MNSLPNPVNVAIRLTISHDDRAFFVSFNNEVQQLFLYRLMVIEAALQKVEEIQRKAAYTLDSSATLY